MAKKSNTKLLAIGGGLAALGGAYWLYKKMVERPDDTPLEEIPVDASSYGNEDPPIDTEKGFENWVDIVKYTPTPSLFEPVFYGSEIGGGPAVGFTEGPLQQKGFGLSIMNADLASHIKVPYGKAEITIRTGVARISYGSDWAGTTLSKLYSNGYKLSGDQVSRLMRKHSADLGYQKDNGYTLDGKPVDNYTQYLGPTVTYIYLRRITKANQHMIALFGPSAPYHMTQNWLVMEPKLKDYGFSRLEGTRQSDGTVKVKADLPPGNYLVFTAPVTLTSLGYPSGMVTMGFSYPRGAWKWTKSFGPMAKQDECKIITDRVFKGKDCGTLKYETSFKRILVPAIMWGDLGGLMVIEDQKVTKMAIQPTGTFMVTSRRSVQTDLTAGMVFSCKAIKIAYNASARSKSIVQAMVKGACKIDELVKKYGK